MAKVAFIGLGVMGYPMARHLAQEGRARADRLQPHRREGGEMGGRAWRPRAPTRRARRPRAPTSSSPASATTTTSAPWRSATTARSPACSTGAIYIDNTTASADGRRASSRRRPRSAASASSMRRSPAARPAPRTAQLTVMVGGDAGDLRQGEAGDRLLRQDGRADGAGRRRASSPRWSTRSASPASCRASPKASTSPRRPGSTWRR